MMTRSKPSFMFEGDLYNPASTQPDIPTYNARVSFMAAINDLAPEVVRTLRSEVRSAYRIAPELIDGVRDTMFQIPDIINHFVQNTDPKSMPNQAYAQAYTALLPYKPLLLKWAADYNLVENWFMASALHKVVMWEVARGGLDDDMLYYHYWSDEILHALLGKGYFEFSTFAWLPYSEKEAAFRERAHHEFTQVLNNYIIKKKQELGEKGWDRIREKRAPEHYDWLVRWQVQGWKLSDIVTKYHRSELTIKKGLKKVAKQIGITLRKARPGRPKNKK